MGIKSFNENVEAIERLELLVASLKKSHEQLSKAQNKSFGAGVVFLFEYDAHLSDVQESVSMLFEGRDLIDPEDAEFERREEEGEEEPEEEGEDDEEEDDEDDESDAH